MILPIFYDASGRRGRSVRRAAAVVGLAVVLALAMMVATVLHVTVDAPLPLPRELARPQAAADVAMPTGSDAGPWMPAARAAPRTAKPLTVGFYMPWNRDARASLSRNVGALDWLVPGLATVTGRDHRFGFESDDHLRRVVAGATRRPRVLPMVQNAREDGSWDGVGTARLLADRRARHRLLDQVEAMVATERGGGVMFDLESLPATAHNDYRRFLSEARARFAPRGWLVTIAAPVADPAWDLTAYARVADHLVLMAYDEHWMGGPAGPIASQPWFADVVAKAVAKTGPDKAIVAIGNYAYDWQGATTEARTIEDAWRIARQAGVRPRFDPASGNLHFSYTQDGATHRVWMLDATTAWNQRRVIDALRPAGIAFWRLGAEDPRLWDVLASDGRRAPDLSRLPEPGGVELAGVGEVMRVDGSATAGHRDIRFDRQGLIRDVRYTSLPSPDVVRRVGNHPRLVALTFDDGPDPRWTPQILDVLKREGVPATFFVTGANALGQSALLRRIVAEGHELGNHSTSHPDLGAEPAGVVRLELNATERLVEAYTGRAMRLFRPPYLGDADPSAPAELYAARIATETGYLTVGLNVDPIDWRSPGADRIVKATIAQVEQGDADHAKRIVLLHDSGGDRSQTVAALPGVIKGLGARGYTLVGVSRLAGITRDQAMPTLDVARQASANTSYGLFQGMAWLRDGLGIVFVAVIALGMARAMLLTGLAWRARHHTAPAAPPHLVPRFVSVLIPAFNEARVIAASVRGILASQGVRLEIIVIDDGSTDGTSEVVTAAFGIDPRVRLLTLANGGKAAALNAGLAVARGDLVVALDADTQFEADTIARLARWFADPAVGAVAGNAKIGNVVNLVTRWQALEYVTSQNLERRALDALGAITVVPGAVGAWRRTAIDDVGGYPTDTLAEDQDLTIAIQRAGWRIACDIDAVAWTEAPETVRALFKQRFRWAYGTLQCLWKHRAVMLRGQPRGLARIGLPQAVLFQLLFALVSPIIDVALLASVIGTAVRLVSHGWAQAGGDAVTVVLFWAAFASVDLACGWVAFRLDPREERFPALRLLMQRFGYRQLLYAVVLRAVVAALTGPRVGWGKLERSGRVQAPIAEPEVKLRRAA